MVSISSAANEIRCQVVPIPVHGGSQPKHALFFHRYGGQKWEFSKDLPSCTVHPYYVASVQCIECVNNGVPLRQSYYCSNKCFLDTWNNHHSYHLCATTEKEKHHDIGSISSRNCWPPVEMVSWFDERVQVVLPLGKEWLVSKMGSLNVFVPLPGDFPISFELESLELDNGQFDFSIRDVWVTDPAIYRQRVAPRGLIQLSDFQKREKFEVTSGVGRFSILTYNILSDIYAYSKEYFYCPQWALTWEYRRRNLLHEILAYDADILCLQEVQSDHFENFFKPELLKYGYSAIYKRKTKELYTINGYTADGCAIFFRNDVFKEVMAYELEYGTTALSVIGRLEPSKRDEARVRLIKDNIALVVVLEMVEDASAQASSSSRLCVVTTHIHAGRDSPDVKLLQVSDLIREIEKIIDKGTPLLICGDMNSIPKSDPYVLLANREVNLACRKKVHDPLDIWQHLKLDHTRKLVSAYKSAFVKSVDNVEGCRMAMMNWKTREPLFTRLTRKHKNTLDYIFYTEDKLEVEGLLEIPDYDSVGRALPSPLWSSDHIALMASFRLTAPVI